MSQQPRRPSLPRRILELAAVIDEHGGIIRRIAPGFDQYTLALGHETIPLEPDGHWGATSIARVIQEIKNEQRDRENLHLHEHVTHTDAGTFLASASIQGDHKSIHATARSHSLKYALLLAWLDAYASNLQQHKELS